jgi:hypothetical protein
MNENTQRKGCRREAVKSLLKPNEDNAANTVRRRIITAEKPRRQNLTNQTRSDRATAKTTPPKMKNSHRPQQKSERAIVLLKSKIEPFLKTNMSMTTSANTDARKEATPRSNPPPSPSEEGERITDEDRPPPTQNNKSKRSTFLPEGNLNNEEYRLTATSMDCFSEYSATLTPLRRLS